jgi:uncharacterized protein
VALTGESISPDQARRIALAAQGFADPRPTGKIDRRHLRKAVERMGLIQIDSVNVLVRSHELPLFSRLGPHPRTLIHDATMAGDLFEYWVHEASLVPMEHYHLHRWRMAQEHRWKAVDAIEQRRPGFLDMVYDRVVDDGPLTSGQFESRVGPKGSWWDWDDAKIALENLFWRGKVAAWHRPNDFARVYDIAERVIPAHVLDQPAPTEDESRKELLVLAAKHHGIATLDDLTDYHRQRNPPCRPLVHELVEEGRLVPVVVPGWKHQAYMHPAARIPRWVRARSLLSPFDPLVWHRDRVERIFGFHYRIEIYVPPPKRQYGYYVLPFLLGDELVARVDLKADRANGTLLVQSAFGEHGIPVDDVVDELAEELSALAGWLGLPRTTVADRGDLALPLRAATARYARG